MSDHSSPIHTLVIGAGPAGLTAAYTLMREGVTNVRVLEKDPHYVGGISRTESYQGFLIDIGGHRFFSKSPEVNALWREILGDDLLTRKRKSRIYFRQKFFHYPLRTWDTFFKLGPIESLRCVLSYLYSRLTAPAHPRTFEQWVSAHFGNRLFRLFFKTYTEKVWGMDCSKISADWAAQRIKGLSLSKAILSAFRFSPNNGGVKTLIQEFLYPRRGPGMLWEKTEQLLREQNIPIEKDAKVTGLDYNGEANCWNVTYEHSDGRKQTCIARHIISSMPLSALIAALGEPSGTPMRDAAKALSYRDFIIVALIAEDRGSFDDNWIYIHEPGVKVGRIQNFKSWSPEMVPDPAKVCYGMEYFCFEGDTLWESSDEELMTLATHEITQLGLAEARQILDGTVIRQKKAYPVYDRDYSEHVETIRKGLEKYPNLQVVGRNGMHKYNNQDHAMMTGMLAVRNILAGPGEMPYDVWRVNQDAMYLEEEPMDPHQQTGRLVPLEVS